LYESHTEREDLVAIPGRTLDRLDSRAKIKIGEKRTSQKGREYPAAVDYFVCPDDEFLQLAGEKPKRVRITLPFATADENFSTGLERWVTAKQSRNQVLTCYTKDGSANPVALRLTDFVREGDEIRGPERGQGRTPITCLSDACVFRKDNSCKPMGRLQFFLEGGRTDTCLQFDTKSWNSIERIAGTLKGCERSGDLRGRVFELSVSFHTKGTDRYPVVEIEEVAVPINTPAQVSLADAYTNALGAVSRGDEAENIILATLLDVYRPGWREDEAYVARVKEVGVKPALDATLKRIETELA
jgi:hypothetical protein